MNLREIRELFLERSGRYDLGSASNHIFPEHSIGTFTPETSSGIGENGADFYINDAQRYLDDRFEQPGLRSCIVGTLDANEDTLVFPDGFRYVQQVLWNDRMLYQKEFDLRCLMQPCCDPIFWMFAPMHSFLDKEQLAKNAPKSWFGVDFLKSEAVCKSIMVSPKPQTKGNLYVMGMAYSLPLKNDEDRSIWTERYSDILLTASLWKLELSYRNTEGSKDYYNALEIMISNALNAQFMQNQTVLGEQYERI